jgi:hypothetical protein
MGGGRRKQRRAATSDAGERTACAGAQATRTVSAPASAAQTPPYGAWRRRWWRSCAEGATELRMGRDSGSGRACESVGSSQRTRHTADAPRSARGPRTEPGASQRTLRIALCGSSRASSPSLGSSPRRLA